MKLKPSLDWLLIFVLLAIILRFWPGGISPTALFVCSALGIIPVAGWIGRATEALAARVGARRCVGDAHLPDIVCWALAREPRGTDERMLVRDGVQPGELQRVMKAVEGMPEERFLDFSYLPLIDADPDFAEAQGRKIERLLDRPRYGLYPPGSTFKLVVAAAALAGIR